MTDYLIIKAQNPYINILYELYNIIHIYYTKLYLFIPNYQIY